MNPLIANGLRRAAANARQDATASAERIGDAYSTDAPPVAVMVRLILVEALADDVIANHQQRLLGGADEAIKWTRYEIELLLGQLQSTVERRLNGGL